MAKNRQKSKQRTKKGHYVAQFYLRGFADASEKLFCYDKAAGRSHPSSTEAAAQERYFYEIPPNAMRELNVPVNAVENVLAGLEGKWRPILDAMIHAAKRGVMSAQEIVDFAPFVAMQWLRTKTTREIGAEVIGKLKPGLEEELIRLGYPQDAVKFHAGEKGMTEVHARQMFDAAMHEALADALERHIWVIGVNNTEHTFYTSDHPVVRRANREADGRRLMGVSDPGIEFVVPLDSRHILLMMERSHFAAWKQHDRKAVPMTVEQVSDYNGLQVMRSYQRVFCAADDFALASDLCAAHPEIRDPKRARVIKTGTMIVAAE